MGVGVLQISLLNPRLSQNLFNDDFARPHLPCYMGDKLQ